MKIQIPTIGPIVGYTTHNQARIWLRGDFQTGPDGFRRGFGVARIAQVGADFGPPQYVKLPPHFDMSGVIAFTGLLPETTYNYQAGWFLADAELEEAKSIQSLDWSNIEPIRFRTGTMDDFRSRSYVLGSCRYLLKLFGGLVFDDRGDKTFGSILKQLEDHPEQPIDGLLMVGDQIYADDLNFVKPDVNLDQFFARYRDVFSQPYVRRLMSRVPTYMILDDHEIEDNWPTKASQKDRVMLYPNAMHSYQVYQCSHSPLFKELDADNRIQGTLTHFWYTFQDGCCDWFVTDSRTERIWSNNPNERRMIKPDQMDALLKWLGDGSGRVKMVVTSVPFFPDLRIESEDKWSGFVPERTMILDFILTNGIHKIVFLSGDVHCSMSAELRSPQDPSFKVISVISSSFFWPYPHMSPGGFVLEGKIKSDPSSPHEYELSNPSAVYSTDNFARLAITTTGIGVSFFGRKGEPLGERVQRSF